VGDNADPTTAEVYEGIIRHINYASHGDIARDTALGNAASCGIGPYRINTKYVAEDSFDQEITIDRILDPLSSFPDPDAMEPDYSDANYWFLTRTMSTDEYKKKYPSASMTSFDPNDAAVQGWLEGVEEGVRIAEYFYVKREKRTLLQLSDGTTGYEDELDIPEGSGVTILKKRVTETRRVFWDTINGFESLDHTEWPGKYIPILMVTGREMVVRGKKVLISLVRFARDPQKLFNSYKSGIAENVGLSTRAPWIGPKGSFKDESWKTANTVNHAYLEYEPQDIAGQPAPPPARNVYEAPIQALSEAASQEADDIKAAANIFDSSLGSASPEYSGVSVLRRTQQADITNFHFIDNLSRTIWHEGRILLDLIPKVYDTARIARIMREDGTPAMVAITQAVKGDDGQETVPLVPGHETEQHHRIDVGRYDVTVTTGPSYTTRRQETFDMLTQFAQAMPQIFQLGGDIIFKNSDIPGAKELAERFKLMLPPQIQQAEGATQASVAQMATQLAQMTMQNKILQGQMQQLLMEKKAKVLELLAKNFQVALQEETKLTIAEMKAAADKAQAMLNAEMTAIDKQLTMFQESEMAPGPDTGNLGIHPEPIPPEPAAAPGAPAGGVQ